MPSASADRGPGGWLDDLLVVELGERIAAGACGSLFAQAGAKVVFVEPRFPHEARGKWKNRALFATGKHSLLVDRSRPDDVSLLEDLLARADCVLLSSDMDGPLSGVFDEASAAAAVVDFTAFGRQHVGAGSAFSDAMVQALSGVAHTSGFADGPPVPLRVPVLEYSAAVYGAAAGLAALRTGLAQSADVALFDCAINSLTTFLPALFGGKDPGRLGNGHAMAAPWNAYRARDGWLLLCSTTDAQWRRICQAMHAPQYIDDPRFCGLDERLANRRALDEVVTAWMRQNDLDACAEDLSAHGLACGSIVPVDDLGIESNLVHRAMIRELPDPQTGTTLRMPGSVFRNESATGRVATQVPVPDEGRQALRALCRARAPRVDAAAEGRKELPLAGLRVLEVGGYTTAPLTARHLANLGAEVLKIEPPGGDVTRRWPPCVDGLGVFFVMSNSGKKSIVVDLKREQGRAAFEELLRRADVLVENLKPGSLGRLGFAAADLARINPRLVYCSISGFGNDTVYHGRPAFDTVIQAMSGMMSANAHDGTPLKAGISACDFMGGEVALFAILAALHRRARSGGGEFIDLSMQDVGAWMTASLWKQAAGARDAHSEDDRDGGSVLACADGYVLAMASADALRDIRAAEAAATLTREQLAAALGADGIVCVPVRPLSEACADPLLAGREIIRQCAGFGGHDWPLLGSPMALSKTPPFVGDPIGEPEHLDAETLARLCGS